MNELVVSAHPDDETLGCGATILRRIAEGHSVHWAIVTRAHSPAWAEDVVEAKSREIDAVASAYGMAGVHRLGFPSMRLDTIPRAELMQALRAVVQDVRPEVVYVTHPGDAHEEHEIVFESVTAVLRAFRMRDLGVRRVFVYETLSSTDAAPALAERAFVPQLLVDVSEFLERKLEIMALYETEAQPDPMPRGPSAIRALARTRGASIGVEYAEAFVVARELA